MTTSSFDNPNIKPVDRAQRDRVAAMSEPMMRYMLAMRPAEALSCLVMMVASVLMSLKPKGGITALQVFDEHLAPSIRETIRHCYEEREREEAGS